MEAFDESKSVSCAVNRLLNTLDVRLVGCSLCSISQGTRAYFDPVDALTVYYILSGEGALQTTNPKPSVFRSRCVVLVPPTFEQIWCSGIDATSLKTEAARCCPVDDRWPRFVQNATSKDIAVIRIELIVTNAGVPGLFDCLRETIVENIPADGSEHVAFRLLLDELARPGIGSTAIAEGLLKSLLTLVLRRHLPASDQCSSSFALMRDPRLARAMMYILEKPAGSHTVDTLAIAAGMSRTVFLARFRKAFSQSPIEFLQGFRLKFASHLLRTTDMPVKSVAMTVGYSSRSYLSRIFSASYGEDPTAYRKRLRGY